jgi:hypothetical protein
MMIMATAFVQCMMRSGNGCSRRPCRACDLTVARAIRNVSQSKCGWVRRLSDTSLRANSIKSLHDVCEDVKRAWSVSNLGYHATAYYVGLTPPPPGVQFSREWGLKDKQGEGSDDWACDVTGSGGQQQSARLPPLARPSFLQLRGGSDRATMLGLGEHFHRLSADHRRLRGRKLGLICACCEDRYLQAPGRRSRLL